MPFKVRTNETTEAEILRIHGLQTPNISVPIQPVDFKREAVKQSEPRTAQVPIDISPAEPIFIGEPDPSLQGRFRERFGGIRAKFQGGVRTHRIEDFLISRQRRF